MVDVITKRLAEQGRQRVVEDVREGRQQFEQGMAKPTSIDDLMREVES